MATALSGMALDIQDGQLCLVHCSVKIDMRDINDIDGL